MMDTLGQPSKQSGPLSPQPSLEQAWLSHRNGPRPPWQFGRKRVKGWRRWARVGEQPFFLAPSQHQGVVLGLCERGVDMSLLRLATNAARGGWKVICFDALGRDSQAATFLAAMQQAGRKPIHIFPHEPYAGWNGTPLQILERLLQVAAPGEPYYQQIATLCLSACLSSGGQPSHLDEIVRRLVDMLQPKRSVFSQLPPILRMVRPADLAGVPLRYGALARLIGDSLDGKWSFEHAEAAYFAFNAWSHPEQARALARFLLADLASYLTERAGGPERVLLLIKRPDLLFDLQRVAPLFAHMEHMGAGLFVAVRSAADLGSQATRILSNAQTLLVHRSSTFTPCEPYVSLPWWSTRSRFNGTVRHLSDDECLVIGGGEVSRIRLDPVVIEAADVLRAHTSLPPVQGRLPAQSTWGGSFPLLSTFPPLDAFASPYWFEDLDKTGELGLPDASALAHSLGGDERADQQGGTTSTPTAKGTPSARSPRHVRGRRTTQNKEE
jgi:hypothetical protein